MSDIRKYFNIIPNNTNNTNNNNTNTNLDKGSINIFTDGSSKNNGQKNKPSSGGIGIYIEDTKECISEKLTGKITNNIAELKACIKGIKHIINRSGYSNSNIIVYSDSEYVINSITKWAPTWYKNGWTKYDKFKKKKIDIKNKELIVELYNLYNTYSIQFIHTKAHGVKPYDENTKEYKLWYGNYMADKLAVDAN